MAQYTEILRSTSQDKFLEIFGASNRKAKDTYLSRMGVKAAKSRGFAKPGAKNEERARKLYDVFKEKEDEELAEEILRTWLLTHRPMLAAALNHMGIDNDQGLTDSDDVEKFEKLKAKEIKAMVKELESVASHDDIAIYLKFMGAPDVDKALK